MSPESSQIGAIWIWRKKHRSMNPSLEMQEGSKGLLKILKGYEDLWKPAPKAGRDNLNDFRSSLKSPEDLLESFKDASEGEIKSRDSSGDLDGNQFKAKWAWLGSERVQQRLSQHIICDYVWEENFYFKFFSFFKSVVCLLQDFDLWIKKMWEEAEAEMYLKGY